MSERAQICAACRITRPMGMMIRATARATGRTRYVCRPSMADQLPGRPPCFAILRSAVEESIELAARDVRPTQTADAARADARRMRVATLAAAVAR